MKKRKRDYAKEIVFEKIYGLIVIVIVLIYSKYF